MGSEVEELLVVAAACRGAAGRLAGDGGAERPVDLD